MYRTKPVNGLLHVGLGSWVSMHHLLAVVPPRSNPIRQILRKASQEGRLVDATLGRRCRAVVVLDNGTLVLSSVSPETLAQRWASAEL